MPTTGWSSGLNLASTWPQDRLTVLANWPPGQPLLCSCHLAAASPLMASMFLAHFSLPFLIVATGPDPCVPYFAEAWSLSVTTDQSFPLSLCNRPVDFITCQLLSSNIFKGVLERYIT